MFKCYLVTQFNITGHYSFMYVCDIFHIFPPYLTYPKKTKTEKQKHISK